MRGTRAWLRAAERVAAAVAGVLLVVAPATAVRGSAAAHRDRGDVPGWVLVTVMTATLVVGLAAVAGPALVGVFEQAIASVAVP